MSIAGLPAFSSASLAAWASFRSTVPSSTPNGLPEKYSGPLIASVFVFATTIAIVEAP